MGNEASFECFDARGKCCGMGGVDEDSDEEDIDRSGRAQKTYHNVYPYRPETPARVKSGKSEDPASRKTPGKTPRRDRTTPRRRSARSPSSPCEQVHSPFDYLISLLTTTAPSPGKTHHKPSSRARPQRDDHGMESSAIPNTHLPSLYSSLSNPHHNHAPTRIHTAASGRTRRHSFSEPSSTTILARNTNGSSGYGTPGHAPYGSPITSKHMSLRHSLESALGSPARGTPRNPSGQAPLTDPRAVRAGRHRRDTSGNVFELTVFPGPTAVFAQFYTLGLPLTQSKGQSRLFQCTHIQSEKHYAVKAIDLNKLRVPPHNAKENFEALRTEYEILKLLHHPNLIRLHGAYENGNTMYLVMDLCTGGPLLNRVAHRKFYQEESAKSIMRQICEGVRFLHERNLAHCDLTLENILFFDQQESSLVKIVQFKHARYTDARNYIERLAGTFDYMAPEVFEEVYSLHADIWSLGVVLFVLLCGHVPFHGVTLEQVRRQVELGFDPSVKKGAGPWFPKERSLSTEARDLISRMLAADPIDRLTIEEVLAHPWLQETPRDPIDRVMQSLPSLNGRYKLRDRLLRALTEELTEKELSELKQSFEKLDGDRNGKLSLAELKAAGSKQQEFPALHKLMNIIKAADVDRDGEISYQELLNSAVAAALMAKEERLVRIFKQMDKMNTGSISRDNIQRYLKISRHEAQEMIDELDRDQDGRISYMEFLNMWRRTVDGQTYAGIKRADFGSDQHPAKLLFPSGE
eukprot:g727.t1